MIPYFIKPVNFPLIEMGHFFPKTQNDEENKIPSHFCTVIIAVLAFC